MLKYKGELKELMDNKPKFINIACRYCMADNAIDTINIENKMVTINCCACNNKIMSYFPEIPELMDMYLYSNDIIYIED